MALVKPDTASFARIKVLGIGGGGGNAINTMIEEESIRGVEFIAINTDAQSLLVNKAETKIQIGEKLTRGLGAGGDPEAGRQAAEESREKLKEYIADTDMVFIAGGEGGGTCTGATPIIAEIARELGALTIAVVTKPFAFEGTRRMVIAEDGIENLKDKVDTLIVIPNQRIMEVIDQKVTLVEAFRVVDGVLGQGAKGIFFNVTGGKDLTMAEVDEAAKIISTAADADANIIFGAVIDDNMVDQIKIIVIATGFDEARLRFAKLARLRAPRTEPKGIISEKPEPGEEIRELEEEEFEKEEKPKEEEEDYSEFDIPAFLRQGR